MDLQPAQVGVAIPAVPGARSAGRERLASRRHHYLATGKRIKPVALSNVD